MKLTNLKVVGLVGVMALLLAACSTSQKQNTTSGQNSDQNQPSAASTATDEANSVVIIYSDRGFASALVTAKVGQKVIFKNTSSKTVQVNSAPHPEHTTYPELNIGAINAGESKSVTFTSASLKKYHNHLNSSENGSIVVQ